MVLADTTVWIDLLRQRDTAPAARLCQLLGLGLAAAAPVIVQEVLQGASSPAGLDTLRDHCIALPMLEPRPGAVTHAGAGALHARCRWEGVAPRSPHDCLIAQLAIENEVSLPS